MPETSWPGLASKTSLILANMVAPARDRSHAVCSERCIRSRSIKESRVSRSNGLAITASALEMALAREWAALMRITGMSAVDGSALKQSSTVGFRQARRRTTRLAPRLACSHNGSASPTAWSALALNQMPSSAPPRSYAMLGLPVLARRIHLCHVHLEVPTA